GSKSGAPGFCGYRIARIAVNACSAVSMWGKTTPYMPASSTFLTIHVLCWSSRPYAGIRAITVFDALTSPALAIAPGSSRNCMYVRSDLTSKGLCSMSYRTRSMSSLAECVIASSASSPTPPKFTLMPNAILPSSRRVASLFVRAGRVLCCASVDSAAPTTRSTPGTRRANVPAAAWLPDPADCAVAHAVRVLHFLDPGATPGAARGGRVRTAPRGEVALRRPRARELPGQTVVPLMAARLHVEPIGLGGLLRQFLLHRPRPRPRRGVLGRHYIFERIGIDARPALDEVQ